MTQYVSGSEVTRRESLLDTIVVRQSYATPLLSMLPQSAAESVITEWSIDQPFSDSDSLRTISNPHQHSRREGADFTWNTPSYPTRLRCVAEIQTEGMEMSGSDRAANVAGMNTTWDYRAGKTFTRILNKIDHVLMYGQGSPETAGTSDERRCQGLISWAAWTGIQRMHGTSVNAMTDPYGITIPSNQFSVFYDAAHTSLTQDLFYTNILSPLLNAGADLQSSPWIFQCGYRLMGRIARFLIADGGIVLNEREGAADLSHGYDFVNWFKFPSGHTVGFRTNRWLNETGTTYTFANSDYTPGAPASPGDVSRTFYADQTLIGFEPGQVEIKWYREPAFRPVATAGDYSRLACVSEFSLKVAAPLCVGGGANLLA